MDERRCCVGGGHVVHHFALASASDRFGSSRTFFSLDTFFSFMLCRIRITMDRFLHLQSDWNRKQNWNAGNLFDPCELFRYFVRVNWIQAMIPCVQVMRIIQCHAIKPKQSRPFRHCGRVPVRGLVCVCVCRTRIECDDYYTRRRSDAKRTLQLFFLNIILLCSVTTTCFSAKSILALANMAHTQTVRCLLFVLVKHFVYRQWPYTQKGNTSN